MNTILNRLVLRTFIILSIPTIMAFKCTRIEYDIREDLPIDGDFYVFTIIADDHESFSAYEKVNGNNFSFTVKFDSTAQYQISETNQADINKLYGFSDCGDLHHTNSARFGWRWYNNKLEIFSYCYNNGERTFTYLQDFEIGVEYDCQIQALNNEYIFKINDLQVGIEPRGCNSNETKAFLYPYFGGDEVAPHNINVYIKDMNER